MDSEGPDHRGRVDDPDDDTPPAIPGPLGDHLTTACVRCHAPLHGDVDHPGRVTLTCRCGTVPVVPRAPTPEEREPLKLRPIYARAAPLRPRAKVVPGDAIGRLVGAIGRGRRVDG